MADHVCTSVAQLNTALAAAVAGDNILVRGVEGGGSGYYQTTNDTTGVSEVRVNAGFHFSNSGTSGSPITLKKYPGDTTPTLSNRASGSTAAIPFPTITFGENSHIVVDGIKVDGAIFVFSTTGTISGSTMSGGRTGNVIKNCEIWEGWETTANGGDGNWSAIRGEKQTFLLVQNNYIHDINDLGNCNNPSSMCGIKLFKSIDSTVEFNTILRVHGYSQAACIDDKDASIRNTHRYNWIEDVATGPRIQNQGESAVGTRFYQNVIILGAYNGRGFTQEDGAITGYEFYNNTIIVTAGSVEPGADDGMVYASQFSPGVAGKMYNNIFYSTTSYKNMTAYASIFSSGICNYNHYANAALPFRYGATNYANLAAIQGVIEANASSGNPLFTSLALKNYILSVGSPCINTGKVGGISGGADVNKGAYITGTEIIGYGGAVSGGGGVPVIRTGQQIQVRSIL